MQNLTIVSQHHSIVRSRVHDYQRRATRVQSQLDIVVQCQRRSSGQLLVEHPQGVHVHQQCIARYVHVRGRARDLRFRRLRLRISWQNVSDAEQHLDAQRTLVVGHAHACCDHPDESVQSERQSVRVRDHSGRVSPNRRRLHIGSRGTTVTPELLRRFVVRLPGTPHDLSLFSLGFALFKVICSILYMLFIIYYMQSEIRSMFKRGMAYFRDFWSYPMVGIVACSWAGFGVYLWRMKEGNRVGALFKATNGYAYVNLQLAAYVTDVLTFLLGFCCFFGSIKFLRLLRFNQRISMLSSTLAHAARDLISFTGMFSIVFFGYLTLFFLLFHSKIWACADPLRTAQMLFEMMLLKFDVSDLYAADMFLGPFCFAMFIIFVVFICMNMVSRPRDCRQGRFDVAFAVLV